MVSKTVSSLAIESQSYSCQASYEIYFSPLLCQQHGLQCLVLLLRGIGVGMELCSFSFFSFSRHITSETRVIVPQPASEGCISIVKPGRFPSTACLLLGISVFPFLESSLLVSRLPRAVCIRNCWVQANARDPPLMAPHFPGKKRTSVRLLTYCVVQRCCSKSTTHCCPDLTTLVICRCRCSISFLFRVGGVVVFFVWFVSLFGLFLLLVRCTPTH